MELRRKQPIGVELVKRGVVTENDIEKALDYQKALFVLKANLNAFEQPL